VASCYPCEVVNITYSPERAPIEVALLVEGMYRDSAKEAVKTHVHGCQAIVILGT
jgi:hypothetical protein